jgi:type II secretory pathway pseudopilin PulG
MIAVAIVSVLAASAAILFPKYVERAKNTEAEIALAEVKRLENDFFARTGTFSSDLNQIGYQSSPPLKYHTIFVQVEKGPRGWGYMVLLMPNGDRGSGGGSYVSQGPDGRIASNVGAQGAAKSGSASGCSVWSGWGTMEGGKIEGEESITSSSNGTPPCGGGRTVQHGRGSAPGAAAK